MDPNIIAGCVIIVGALGLLIYLVLWSRRTINRIDKSDSATARQILKELHSGK